MPRESVLVERLRERRNRQPLPDGFGMMAAGVFRNPYTYVYIFARTHTHTQILLLTKCFDSWWTFGDGEWKKMETKRRRVFRTIKTTRRRTLRLCSALKFRESRAFSTNCFLLIRRIEQTWRIRKLVEFISTAFVEKNERIFRDKKTSNDARIFLQISTETTIFFFFFVTKSLSRSK